MVTKSAWKARFIQDKVRQLKVKQDLYVMFCPTLELAIMVFKRREERRICSWFKKWHNISLL